MKRAPSLFDFASVLFGFGLGLLFSVLLLEVV